MAKYDKNPGGDQNEFSLRLALSADLARNGVRKVEPEPYEKPAIDFSKFKYYKDDVCRYCQYIMRYLRLPKVYDEFADHNQRRDFREELERKYTDKLPPGWNVYDNNCLSTNALTGLDGFLQLLEEKLEDLDFKELVKEVRRLQRLIRECSTEQLFTARDEAVDNLKNNLKIFLERLYL